MEHVKNHQFDNSWITEDQPLLTGIIKNLKQHDETNNRIIRSGGIRAAQVNPFKQETFGTKEQWWSSHHSWAIHWINIVDGKSPAFYGLIGGCVLIWIYHESNEGISRNTQIYCTSHWRFHYGLFQVISQLLMSPCWKSESTWINNHWTIINPYYCWS